MAEEFGKLKVYARKGPGGRDRLEANPVTAVAPQALNKAGEALDHWHVYIAPAAHVPGEKKLRSIDQRRLHRDLAHVSDRINSRVAELYREKLGVRVELHGHTLRCPDVPLACVNATSTRKVQIDAYLQALGIPPTPYARRIAAHVTRHWNSGRRLDPNYEAATRRLCARHGFEPARVYGQERPRPAGDVELCRLVTQTADALAKKQGVFTRPEHEARLHRLAVRNNVRASDVDRMVERMYANWPVFGIHRLPDGQYTTRLGRAAWDHVYQAASRLPRPQLRDLLRPVQSGAGVLLRPARGGGAGFLRPGVGAAAQEGPHDTARRGRLRRDRRPGSPLLPGSLGLDAPLKAHMRAALAALKPGLGGLSERLRHAEHVYRNLRHPKEQLTRRSVVVVRNAGQERPIDLARLIRLAERHGATVILRDREQPQPGLQAVATRLWPSQPTAAQNGHANVQQQGAKQPPPPPPTQQELHL